MRKIFIILAILLASCRSTRNTTKIDRDVTTDRVVDVSDKIDRVENNVENRDVIRYIEEVVEISEETQTQPQDSSSIPTRKEKRVTRTFEIDKSTFESIVNDESKIDSIVKEQSIDNTVEEKSVEVEDSTPRNLRWIGILGICAAIIAICIVILRLKK